MKIHGDQHSGNCYKLRLLCALLSIPHDWVPVDILRGETTSDEFLARNPAGMIPVLETDDGEFLSESNAILYYLASNSDYWPSDLLEQVRVLQWQFFEQYSHEPFIAVARFIKRYLDLPETRRQEYESKLKPGYRALDIMENRLKESPWLVGVGPTIADISLYAYTHVAHEGGFDLSGYPAIRDWLKRIASLPRYVGMAE